MPRQKQVMWGFSQSFLFVVKKFKRDSGIKFRIISLSTFQSSVLIVLYKMMIGVLGKGQRTQPERIDRRELQQPQIGFRGGKVRQVKGNQVMPQKKRCPVSKTVQSCQFCL